MEVLLLLAGLLLFSSLRSTTASMPPALTNGDPRDIVLLSGHDGREVKVVRYVAVAFYQLQLAAQKAGFQLLPTSGYRTFEEQQTLWDAALKKYKTEAKARKYVAKPGNSKHEEGIAIDVWLGYDAVSANVAKIHKTEIYQWLQAHANSYKFRWYDRTIEPWHLEYYDISAPNA
jgi:LAS superfamily LD-carboxypeptidase LdcB